MRALRLISTLLAVFWSAASAVEAQSLAEAARQERRRRAQQHTPGKVFTNEDLSQYSSRSQRPSSGRPVTSSTSSESASSSLQLAAADEERQWSRQFIEAKAKVEAAKQRQAALQAKITDEQELADLREQLRKSGKSLSRENSQAALRPETSPGAGGNRQEPKSRTEPIGRSNWPH